MNNSLSRFMNRTIAILKGRKGDDYAITVHPDEVVMEWLTLEGESGSRSVRWNEISSVVTYKRDLYTSDMLCLLCKFSDGSQFEFNEEMSCWQSLVDALSLHLPGFPAYSEWWHPVAVPAFSTNERLLFQREGSQLSDPHS